MYIYIIIIHENATRFSGWFVTCVIINNNNNFDRSSRILFLWFSQNYNRSSQCNSEDCIKTIKKKNKHFISYAFIILYSFGFIGNIIVEAHIKTHFFLKLYSIYSSMMYYIHTRFLEIDKRRDLNPLILL